MIYVGEMKREVAEVIRRLHFHFVAIPVNEPAKGAESEHRETSDQKPDPDRAIIPPGNFDGGENLSFPRCPALRAFGFRWRRSVRRERWLRPPQWYVGGFPVGEKGNDKSSHDRDRRQRPTQSMGQ